jgi:uncharacterized protein GlcG (DUF336 family)
MLRISRPVLIAVAAALLVAGLSIRTVTIAADKKDGGSAPAGASGTVIAQASTVVTIPAGGTLLLADDSKTGGPAAPITTKDMSLEQAHKVLEAAIAKSNEIKTKMDIAVVDAGGNLKAFARQDGAWLGSIDISIKKAKTARFFDMPTGEIGKLSQPGGPLYQIEVSNGGLITFPGGVPIKDADGTVIGAVGVSGSSVENDHTVAAAGAAALGK